MVASDDFEGPVLFQLFRQDAAASPLDASRMIFLSTSKGNG